MKLKCEFFLLLSLLSFSVLAQNNSWNFTVAPYGWLPWITGSVTVQGNKSDVDATPSDILNVLDTVLSLHMEANKGNITYMLDPLYLKLSATEGNGIGKAEVTLKEWMADMGVYYRFLTHKMNNSNNCFMVESFVGGRYWNMDVTTKITIQLPPPPAPELTRTFNMKEKWLDPLIGARLIYTIGDNWLFYLHGDVGGFGLVSHFTWKTDLIGIYKFNRYIGVSLGFRALGDDYTNGTGANKFNFDNIMYGPVVGVTIHF